MTNFETSKPISGDARFFTVLIPTMNRPQLLDAAIQSVLWQSFKDLELIVSDNSSTEESIRHNRKTVDKHSNDRRLQYIRPPEWMSMPDHWEFASRHASGRYVVILPDRHVMRPSALDFIYTTIAQLQEDIKVISYHISSEFNQSGIVCVRPFSGDTKVIDSKQEICEFARCANWKYSLLYASNRLPRMTNGCYRFDVAQTIREKHGRLFMPVSPDYTCAFLLLAYTDRFAHLDRPLAMCHGNQSNGQSALVYGSDKYVSSLGDVDTYAWTPGSLRTVTGLVIRDLMMVKHLVGSKYSDVRLDLVGYFMCNYRELMWMERLGSQVDVHALYKQWCENIKQLYPEQQQLINQYVNELAKQRSSFIGLRRLSVRLNLARLYPFLIGMIRQIRRRLSGRPVYANVLEAATQTDYMVSSDPTI